MRTTIIKSQKWSKAYLLLLTVAIIAIGFFSCKKDDPEPEDKFYNVTLVRNNGQADTVIQVKENTKLTKPKDPVKAETSEGSFAFDAWYTTSDFSGSPFNFTLTFITADISLYAKYNATYKITFHTLKTDGSADSTFVVNVPDGETLPILEIAIPRKDSENKFFTGWFDAASGGTEYTAATPVTQSVDIYYQMVSTNYAVFDVDGVNRTLAIGGYVAGSPEQITNVTNFSPPAKIGVYSVKKIGNNMFYPVDDGSSNTTLTTVVIPEGVEKIIGQVFRNCAALSSVTLPSTLNEIDGPLFWGTGALSTITIPEGVTYMPVNGFVASGLTSITLPSTITQIRDAAFVHSKKLTSISIPDNVTFIGTNAFGGNDALTTVSFNVATSKLDSIAQGAFFDCINLSSLTLPNSLRVIGGHGARNMFINNLKLTTVTLPANLQRLGGGAFALCDMLTEVIFLGNTPPFMEDAVFNKREGTPYVTIKVPAAALQTYLDACVEPYPYGEDWKWWNTCCGTIIANSGK